MRKENDFDKHNMTAKCKRLTMTDKKTGKNILAYRHTNVNVVLQE